MPTKFKKLLVIILLSFVAVGSILPVFIYADDEVPNDETNEVSISSNGDIKIYERFIKKETYNNLGTMSIWKYDKDYKTALIDSLDREEPIQTIEIEFDE